MSQITDEQLRRMVRLDQGDSYILHLPDGTRQATGYTAEGSNDNERALVEVARRIYDRWESDRATTNQEQR